MKGDVLRYFKLTNQCIFNVQYNCIKNNELVSILQFSNILTIYNP